MEIKTGYIVSDIAEYRTDYPIRTIMFKCIIAPMIGLSFSTAKTNLNYSFSKFPRISLYISKLLIMELEIIVSPFIINTLTWPREEPQVSAT